MGDPGLNRSLRFLNRNDADPSAMCAMVRELDATSDLGEQRIVFASADIRARPEPLASLTYQDRAAGHQVAVESLDAEPLRVAIAPVTGAALSFFVCHDELLGPAAVGPATCSYTLILVTRTRVC